MRRKVGLALIAVGALFLVLAPLLSWYAYPRLAVRPRTMRARRVHREDVTIFSIPSWSRAETRRSSPTSRRPAARSRWSTTSRPEPATTRSPSGRPSSTPPTPEGRRCRATRSIVAFDRNTGAGVEGYGQSIDGDPIDHEGQILKFPFGTDTARLRVLGHRPARGDARRVRRRGRDRRPAGLPLRPDHRADRRQPVRRCRAAWPVGGAVLEADRTYANTRTLWVEPDTGVIMRGQEEQDTVLVYGGEEIVTITSGDPRITPTTRSQARI